MSARVVVVGLASVALHLAGFGILGMGATEVTILGGAPSSSARLGSSFADMVSGAATQVDGADTPTEPVETVVKNDAVLPETTTSSSAPVQANATAADVAATPVRPETAPLVSPEERAVVADETGNKAQPATTLSPIASEQASESAQPVPIENLPATVITKSKTVASLTSLTRNKEVSLAAPAKMRAEPSLSAAPHITAASAFSRPPDTPLVPSTVTAVPPVEVSPNPRSEALSDPVREIVTQRAERAETAVEHASPPKRRAVPKPPKEPRHQQRPESDQDAVRGTNNGTRDGKSASQSQTSQPLLAQGNSAAVSNYPGLIWSKLSRVRRDRNIGRGTAVIAFSIGANGGVVSASIQKSSGNKSIDTAGLRHVKRAAPFPPPPAGAKTQFSFSFESRG